MAGDVQAPTRVAAVIGQLTVGGAENQLCEFVRALDRRRYAPIVYSLAESHGGVDARLDAAGVPVRKIGALGIERARRLAQALAADQVQLIHSWLYIANTYAWACRHWGVRVPLVTSARNCKSQGIGHHVANVAAFRASARVIANSKQVREYIVRCYYVPAGRVDVVYNGVDTERFRPSGECGQGPVTIVTAGRLVKQKNPRLFLTAAARLRRACGEVRFVMVGDGPLRGMVVERARSLGIADAVELTGERLDWESVLKKADIFWLTSSWEGLPNVVMEAMACGLPVVATDVGGTRELFTNGREGFLARPDEAEDFVRYGLRLVRDRALRAAMGEAARRRAEQFSIARMTAETEAVYSAALRARP